MRLARRHHACSISARLLPGPLATLILAEAGAEVIKIERPGTGDEMRGYAPRFGPDSVNFALLNRGKRSIALDLKEPGAAPRASTSLLAPRRCSGRTVPARRDGSAGARLRGTRRDLSAPRLLRHHRPRQRRSARAGCRPRSQLPRRDGHADAVGGRRRDARAAAGADRRYRRRRLSGGDEYPDGAAGARGDGQGMPARHFHVRQSFPLHVLGDGKRACRGGMAEARRRARDRRLAALPDLSYRRRPLPGRRPARRPVLGQFLRRDRPSRPNCATIARSDPAADH